MTTLNQAPRLQPGSWGPRVVGLSPLNVEPPPQVQQFLREGRMEGCRSKVMMSKLRVRGN